MPRDLSAHGAKVLEGFEVPRHRLYDDATGKTIAHARDTVGHATIGIGHACTPSEIAAGMYDGVTLSDDAIDALFRHDLGWRVILVNKDLGAVADTISQNAFDALVSFGFNEGLGALAGSDLLNHVLAGEMIEAAAAFAPWNKWRPEPGGPLVVSVGLTHRRALEAKLFLTPDGTDPQVLPEVRAVDLVAEWLATFHPEIEPTGRDRDPDDDAPL